MQNSKPTTVTVERTSTGTFRLTMPDGKREFIQIRNEGDSWNRAYAIEAKDVICSLYGLKRYHVSFDVM